MVGGLGCTYSFCITSFFLISSGKMYLNIQIKDKSMSHQKICYPHSHKEGWEGGVQQKLCIHRALSRWAPWKVFFSFFVKMPNKINKIIKINIINKSFTKKSTCNRKTTSGFVWGSWWSWGVLIGASSAVKFSCTYTSKRECVKHFSCFKQITKCFFAER